MFQSRPGFSPCLDKAYVVLRSPTARFNPVLGFLPVSTCRFLRTNSSVSLFQSRPGFSPCLDTLDAWILPRPPEEFQSRPGFSPCLDPRSGSAMTGPWRVSIPSWVFSLSRHRQTDFDHSGSKNSFNPVLGFLPVSTVELEKNDGSEVLFQSRPGFSPCLDQALLAGVPAGAVHVSIPSWVFSLSRPVDKGLERHLFVGFQSRPGFSPCLDTTILTVVGIRIRRFNPVLGFLPVSTPGSQATVVRCPKGFNPVLGFLPVSTRPTGLSHGRHTCFNPVLGFLPVSTGDRTGRTQLSESFNPVLGFLPVSTFVPSVLIGGVTRFNPVLGFLPVSTTGLLQDLVQRD